MPVLFFFIAATVTTVLLPIPKKESDANYKLASRVETVQSNSVRTSPVSTNSPVDQLLNTNQPAVRTNVQPTQKQDDLKPPPTSTPTPKPTTNPRAEKIIDVSGAVPNPVTLKIASIKLVAPVIETGLEPNGALHVPSSPDMTGWYRLGAKPGETGPAVITGHLDSKAGPGILYNLKNVKIGNEVKIVRSDGTTAIFTVDKLELYPQDNFNTQAVYGPISTAGLRIITCAGTYNKSTGHYSDDLVVYATLNRIEQPGAYEPL